MIAAISGTEQFDSARRVTAVPRKSWKCRSLSDVFRKALSQLVLNPSSVHGRPNELTSMVTAERFSFSAASSAAFSGGAYRDGYAPPALAPAALRLPHSDVRAVVILPGQSQQVPLALPGPQRKQERGL